MTRFARFVLIIPALAMTVAAAAAPFPPSISLPDDFAPEGIAVGTGSTFYVGSLVDGDIYRGDLRTGEGAVFIDAPPGRQSAGLKVDEAHHRLFVAGGATGHAYVYDTRDGSPLSDIQLTAASPTLINDVAVTKGGAYFTDSLNPDLYKVPISADGVLGAPQTIALTGPASALLGFPNLNGIDATTSGDMLVVGHSALGAVLTVDPVTGASKEIALTGGSLIPGMNDGILLDGTTLWVVENFANRLVKIRLAADLASGHISAVVTNADLGGRFRVPTTVAQHGHQLAIVNGRFDQGLPPPLGSGAPPGTDYNVVVVDKP
jgi:hypothetical protein